MAAGRWGPAPKLRQREFRRNAGPVGIRATQNAAPAVDGSRVLADLERVVSILDNFVETKDAINLSPVLLNVEITNTLTGESERPPRMKPYDAIDLLRTRLRPGVVGGGAAHPRPGEVSLAHNGVLFLDELPEFSRPTLEVLPEPLVSGEVVLGRASGTLRFPSRCLVVASMAPCPCGHHGTPRCRCTRERRERYTSRVPARLLELFDVRLRLESIDLARLDDEPHGRRLPKPAPTCRCALSWFVKGQRARTTCRSIPSPPRS